MDTLNPQLIWIGSRCYRVNGSQLLDHHHQSRAESGYVEEDLYSDDDTEDFDIELTENNCYKTSYHVPSMFFSQIIGSKGMTKKRIEAETKTQLIIPKPGVEGDIVIIGPTAKTVASARRKVDLIVMAARKKQESTHFLSIPIKDQDIVDAFSKFKSEVLASVDETYELLFQNPSKLHLTFIVLSLMDNEDRANAAQLLHECQESIIKPVLSNCGEIRVRIRGLDCMNDDPSAVHILYGKVVSEPLQIVADNIADYFTKKGLMRKKGESVKLHATLMNSKFRLKREKEIEQQMEKRTFDARHIMERFGDFEFGTFVPSEIHLSQRRTTACDGYYEATAIIKLEQ